MTFCTTYNPNRDYVLDFKFAILQEIIRSLLAVTKKDDLVLAERAVEVTKNISHLHLPFKTLRVP